MQNIGKRIKEARLEKGITQEELANKVHVTKQSVSGWETGKFIPDGSIIPEIFDFLGIEPNAKDITLAFPRIVRKKQMKNYPPLFSIKTIESFDQLVENLLSDFRQVHPFSYAVIQMDKMLLTTMLGMTRYNYWSDEENCDYLEASSCIDGFASKNILSLSENSSNLLYAYSDDLDYTVYKLGGDLFEDFKGDENKHSIGQEAYSNWYALKNILTSNNDSSNYEEIPYVSNSLITEFRVSLVCLKDFLLSVSTSENSKSSC